VNGTRPWNSGKSRWALLGCLGFWMPVMGFRVVGHFVARAFWKTPPRVAAQLFGNKAHRNNPASKRGKRKHQTQSVFPSTLYGFSVVVS
jgi:hypothetical protein